MTEDKERKFRRYTYTGFLDFELRERSDQWGIMLFVQTIDPNPVGPTRRSRRGPRGHHGLGKHG